MGYSEYSKSYNQISILASDFFEDLMDSGDYRYLNYRQSYEFYIFNELTELSELELKKKYSEKIDINELKIDFEHFKNEFYEFKNYDEYKDSKELFQIEHLRIKCLLKVLKNNLNYLEKFHLKKKTRILINLIIQELNNSEEILSLKLLKIIEKENEEEKNILDLPVFRNLKIKQMYSIAKEVSENYSFSSIENFFEKIQKKIEMDFNEDFSKIMMKIPNYNEKEKLNYFIEKLFIWNLKKILEQGKSSFDTFYEFLNNSNQFHFLELEEDLKEFSHESLIESKNISLDFDLIQMIKDTSNEIEYKNLLFDDLFIDTAFNIDKDYTVSGIILTNLDKNTRKNELYFDFPFQDILFNGYVEESDIFYKENVSIIFLIQDKKEKREFLSVSFLNDYLNKTEPIFDDLDIGINLDPKIKTKISKEIFNFCFNLMDLLNNKQITYEEIKNNRKRNYKLIERGSFPKPIHKIIIKPKMKLKKYALEYNDNIRKLSYKFQVRGHYVSYRDKKKYSNLYKKYKQGELNEDYSKLNGVIRYWKKPYFKGEGIILNKKINVVE